MSTGRDLLLVSVSLRFNSTDRQHMAKQKLPQDFREFLRLLSDHEIDYLLIGGYAVGFYGHPRTTADMDVWVSDNPENARRLVRVLEEFGMVSDNLTPELFLTPGNIVRMGLPPVRIEILNDIDGVTVRLISLSDLRRNKRASGRHKDLDDLEHLPEE